MTLSDLKSTVVRFADGKVNLCSDILAAIDLVDFESISNQEEPVAMSGEMPVFGESAYSIKDGVATIKIRGVLVPGVGADIGSFGITGYDVISHYIAKAEEDSQVQKVLFHIDSPGGTTKGLDATVKDIKVMTKPSFAYTETYALSAAYWIGSTASEFYASENSELGSIGVYIEHTDRSESLEASGIKKRIFKSGFWKGAFSSSRPLSEREQERLQAMVDDQADIFFEHVAESRGIEKKSVRDMDGDKFIAKKALTFGLIDGIKGSSNWLFSSEASVSGDSELQASSEETTMTEEEMQAAIEAAKAEGRAEGLAQAGEGAAQVATRIKTIMGHKAASDEVKDLLCSDAFESVEAEQLVALMDLIPSFSSQMDEEGGAGLESDPSEIDGEGSAEKEAKAAAEKKVADNLKAMAEKGGIL